jgi:hypothetical protein
MARRLGIGKTTVNNWGKALELFFRKNTVDEDFLRDRHRRWRMFLVISMQMEISPGTQPNVITL